MIYTKLKAKYVNLPPKSLTYRNYNNFDKIRFDFELKGSLSTISYGCFEEFESYFINLLSLHEPENTMMK